MTYFADLDRKTLSVAGEAVRAIGWLARDHEYRRGASPVDFLTALRTLRQHWGVVASLLPWWPVFAGSHGCELCGDHGDSGEIAVPFGEVLFVAPTMVVHYVENHEYLPPTDFVRAVLTCPAPSSAEYSAAILLIASLREGNRWRLSNAHRDSENPS